MISVATFTMPIVRSRPRPGWDESAECSTVELGDQWRIELERGERRIAVEGR